MKKTLFLIMLLPFSFAMAQNEIDVKNMQEAPQIYKLYPTQNMYIFLELNTTNGLINIVQWGTDMKDLKKEPLSVLPIGRGENQMVGRFELYPTQNIYNFILLDKLWGTTFQVQWDFDSKNRMLIPIG